MNSISDPCLGDRWHLLTVVCTGQWTGSVQLITHSFHTLVSMVISSVLLLHLSTLQNCSRLNWISPFGRLFTFHLLFMDYRQTETF